MNSLESTARIDATRDAPANWVLRWVVVIQCVGLGGRYLLSSGETESDIYGWLYFDLLWPERICQGIDDAGMVLTLVAAA